MICKHCGHKIAKGQGDYYYHTDGRGAHLGRCQETEKPYGYNAEPIGAECRAPCAGTRYPDVEERRA